MNPYEEFSDEPGEVRCTLMFGHNVPYSENYEKFIDSLLKLNSDWEQWQTETDEGFAIRERKKRTNIFVIGVTPKAIQIGIEAEYYEDKCESATDALALALDIFIENKHRRITHVDFRYRLDHTSVPELQLQSVRKYLNQWSPAPNDMRVESAEWLVVGDNGERCRYAIQHKEKENELVSSVGYAQTGENDVKFDRGMLATLRGKAEGAAASLFRKLYSPPPE